MVKRTAQSLKSEARQNVNNALAEMDQVSIILVRQCEEPELLRSAKADLEAAKSALHALLGKL